MKLFRFGDLTCRAMNIGRIEINTHDLNIHN